jgi:Tol biopolymer transport system component/DNA-binding winged helix-turn-helix (wHTH) protein
MSEPQRFFEFDNFLLDMQQRLLFRDGQPVELTPKVFDVLFELVQNSGRIVEKKELMDRIWPDSFVEEANLTQHVSVLRKKLGHDAQQRYIVTVPGRGYRFVAPIKSWDDDAIVTVQERIRSRVTVTDGGAALPAVGVDTVQSSPRLLSATADRTFHKRIWVPLICLLIAATIVAVGYFVLRRGPATPPFAKFKLTRFTTDGRVDTAAISPNGKYVAYALVENGQYSLWIRQTATANAGINLIPTGSMGYLGMTFSPDNDYIYFTAGPVNSPTAIYRMPALGGNRERLVEDVDSAAAFSPDGKRIAYLRGYPDKSQTVLYTAGNDGRGETALVTLTAPGVQLNLRSGPSWSPDGESIACSATVRDDAGAHQEIYLANARTGEFKPLTNAKWVRMFRVGWTKDGKGIIAAAGESDPAFAQIWYVSYPSAATRKITNDLSDYRALTMTADSQVIAVVQFDQRSNIFVSPSMDGAGSQQITNSNYDGASGLVWTPDGHLVYSVTRNGIQDLWITSGDGKEQRQLTQNAGQNSFPAVSPDGKTIAFVSTRDGDGCIWKIGLDGTRAERLTQGRDDSWPVFSADGQWIFYRSLAGPTSVNKVAVNGGPSVTVLDKGLPGPPAISPDGKTVALSVRQPALSPQKIVTAPVDSLGDMTVLSSTEAPRRLLVQWTRDGTGLVYIKAAASVSNIWRLPLDGGTPRQLTNFTGETIYNFALAADGRLALSRGHEISDVVLISAIN